MKIHDSEYEKLGWISLNQEKPEPLTKVRLSQIHILDWNLEVMNWETTGWFLPSGSWSVKASEGINLNNSKPTHWKNIEE